MLLPPLQRTGEIHFHVAKRLPYTARLIAALLLMAAGLGVQALLFEGPWAAGLVPLFLGVLLLLPKGYDNSVSLKAANKDWRPAKRAEVERILELNAQQKRWDSDAFDITSGKGLGMLVLTVIAMFLLLGYLERLGTSDQTRLMVAANAAVMLIPFWISGVRFILKNDKLVVKTKMFLNMETRFDTEKRDGEEFGYQLQTARAIKGTGEVPRDVKAVVRFAKGPEEFLGLQMQIAINSVQGKDYPYFYCVLVGKESIGETMENRIERPPSDIVLEPKYQDGVYVAVIRQKTTKNSGYHTNSKAAAKIFGYALKQARAVSR
ncbi:MAG: hypothetical protein RBU21_12370 [FCB group bacterium]|jgi:hypothetical protein|nr:hypothetical protein [FCB group bacterium]